MSSSHGVVADGIAVDDDVVDAIADGVEIGVNVDAGVVAIERGGGNGGDGGLDNDETLEKRLIQPSSVVSLPMRSLSSCLSTFPSPFSSIDFVYHHVHVFHHSMNRNNQSTAMTHLNVNQLIPFFQRALLRKATQKDKTSIN